MSFWQQELQLDRFGNRQSSEDISKHTMHLTSTTKEAGYALPYIGLTSCSREVPPTSSLDGGVFPLYQNWRPSAKPGTAAVAIQGGKFLLHL